MSFTAPQTLGLDGVARQLRNLAEVLEAKEKRNLEYIERITAEYNKLAAEANAGPNLTATFRVGDAIENGGAEFTVVSENKTGYYIERPNGGIKQYIRNDDLLYWKKVGPKPKYAVGETYECNYNRGFDAKVLDVWPDTDGRFIYLVRYVGESILHTECLKEHTMTLFYTPTQ